MEMRYLWEFCVLAETGHYSQAASQLYISQSTLSKHIKSIENEVGMPLFLRTTRKVELTEHGKIFLPYAQKIVELQTECADALLNHFCQTQKQIKIGAIPALAQYNITDMMVRFRQAHPGFEFEITQAGTAPLKELLRAGEIELAFVREVKPPRDNFVYTPYMTDRMVAVLPAGHPLADSERISIKMLSREEFILIEQNTLLYDLCIDVCKENGFTPTVAYADHKIENIIDLVQKGMGVSLLMDRLATHNQASGIAVVPIEPAVQTNIYICHRKDAPLSTAAKYFLEALKRY